MTAILPHATGHRRPAVVRTLPVAQPLSNPRLTYAPSSLSGRCGRSRSRSTAGCLPRCADGCSPGTAGTTPASPRCVRWSRCPGL